MGVTSDESVGETLATRDYDEETATAGGSTIQLPARSPTGGGRRGRRTKQVSMNHNAWLLAEQEEESAQSDNSSLRSLKIAQKKIPKLFSTPETCETFERRVCFTSSCFFFLGSVFLFLYGFVATFYRHHNNNNQDEGAHMRHATSYIATSCGFFFLHSVMEWLMDWKLKMRSFVHMRYARVHWRDMEYGSDLLKVNRWQNVLFVSATAIQTTSFLLRETLVMYSHNSLLARLLTVGLQVVAACVYLISAAATLVARGFFWRSCSNRKYPAFQTLDQIANGIYVISSVWWLLLSVTRMDPSFLDNQNSPTFKTLEDMYFIAWLAMGTLYLLADAHRLQSKYSLSSRHFGSEMIDTTATEVDESMGPEWEEDEMDDATYISHYVPLGQRINQSRSSNHHHYSNQKDYRSSTRKSTDGAAKAAAVAGISSPSSPPSSPRPLRSPVGSGNLSPTPLKSPAEEVLEEEDDDEDDDVDSVAAAGDGSRFSGSVSVPPIKLAARKQDSKAAAPAATKTTTSTTTTTTVRTVEKTTLPFLLYKLAEEMKQEQAQHQEDDHSSQLMPSKSWSAGTEKEKQRREQKNDDKGNG